MEVSAVGYGNPYDNIHARVTHLVAQKCSSDAKTKLSARSQTVNDTCHVCARGGTSTALSSYYNGMYQRHGYGY